MLINIMLLGLSIERYLQHTVGHRISKCVASYWGGGLLKGLVKHFRKHAYWFSGCRLKFKATTC